jgi:iron complex transport system substrate-binding protein
VLARRIDPKRARLEHIDGQRLSVPALDLRDPGPNLVSREPPSDEDHEPVQPGNAVAAERERLDGELDQLISCDRRGHEASLARGYSGRLVRICSLLPSATEIIARLGLTDSLVGVSEECDWPAETRGLPVVTASRVEAATLSSAEIDSAVRNAVADGRSLYAVDADLLTELAPDVIVTQDLCTVCAVSGDDVSTLCPIGAEVISLNPATLEEIARSVETLGRRLGVPERGLDVAGEMRSMIDAVRRSVAGRPTRRIFVAEWVDPPFAAGHWLPEMVAAAGGSDALGRAGKPSFPVTWDDVRAARPELVVVAACGFDAERGAEEARLADLPAPSVAVDANAYYSRPAPRVADGVRQLGHLLHPDACPDPGLPAVQLTSRHSADAVPSAASPSA